jgi:hypothetical protein
MIINVTSAKNIVKTSKLMYYVYNIFQFFKSLEVVIIFLVWGWSS